MDLYTSSNVLACILALFKWLSAQIALLNLLIQWVTCASTDGRFSKINPSSEHFKFVLAINTLVAYHNIRINFRVPIVTDAY